MKCNLEDCCHNKNKQCQAEEADELSNNEECMSGGDCPSFKPKKSKQS